MRVLIVTNTLRVGGAERVVTELARGLQARGHSLHAATMGGHYVAELEASGAQHHLVEGLYTRHPAQLLRAAHRLAKVIQQVQPDVINVHSYILTPVMALAAARARSHAVRLETVHIPEKAWYYPVMGRTLPFLVQDVSTVCAHTLGELHAAGLPRRLGQVIYNGIDAGWLAPMEAIEGRPLPHQQPQVRLGVLARLIERKGVQDLIQALAQLKQEGCARFTLEVAGDGPYRPTLEALTSSLGLGDSVRFLGERKDAKELLDRLDVFVLPSRFEAFPMSILEAMARGTPVLCSAVNGVPEAVEEGRTGLLFAKEDVAGLVQALRRLLVPDDSVASLRREARGLVERRFITPVMVEGYEAWYARALEARGSARQA